MKTFLYLIVVAGLSLPFAVACSHTVSSSEQTTRHIDGSVSHDQTTVKQNDLTGTVTTDKEHLRN